nr:MAG TPA: Terminase large subunit [Caudoviricetes sp.]
MMNPDLIQELPNLNFCEQGNKIFVKPGVYPLSSRKLDGFIKIANLQKYYQCNPVKFINDFFNIELLDAQAWVIQRAWNCPNVLLVCTRGFGKSTLIDIMIMAKDMLFNNYWTYIASGSGSQAEQTFTTLERLANDNIDTMLGSTGYIFKAEIEIKNAAGDGFSHSSNGFSYSLYNGSFTQTLNSNVDKKRGMRGSVVFDECGFLDEEMMSVYAAFAIVNKSFKSGKDRDGKSIDRNRLRCIPSNIPNQLFYISSASSTDTKFYKLYRDFSKRQLMGDPDYFVAHIDCEIAFKPTIRGEIMEPLLTPGTVAAEMRSNPEKARREYYCEFTSDAGANAIIRRGVIARNEVIRKPVLYNDTGKRKIVIAYDPARSRDNSVILVCEIYSEKNQDGDLEYKMRLLNCINLIDISNKKKKKPMQTPAQIEYLKQVILDYNQGGDDSYSNILGIYIDAGSGGGGVNIADYLMPDWKDKSGKTHRGLIDKEYSEEYVKKFPNAVNKLHLMEPTKYKSEMYEAMIELMNQDKIEFTATYDHKGYLTIFDVDKDKYEKTKKDLIAKYKKQKMTEEEINYNVQVELDNLQNVKSHIEKLNWQEEISLASIDALKEELVNMIRIPRQSGKDSFELCPEKASRLHDDRAYVTCMCSYALQVERRKNITDKRKPKTDKSLVQKLTIRKGIVHSMFDS